MGLNLELLFNKVLQKAYQTRKKNKNYNGLKLWRPIKEMLKEYDNIKANKWKKINKKITKQVMLLPEYYINGYDKKHIIDE